MQQASEPHSDSQRAVCPGVSGTVAWDDASSLRGELFSSDHLAEHAAEVAKAHGKPSSRITPGPLRKRFAAARARIRAAYEILSRDFPSKREPTPAEEWLLDNSHVVDEQIREIQEDLPWGYLVELPRVSQGAMRGYPRVYGLCLDYLRHTDARVDLTSLASYVLSYQRVSRLTIGELWAVPIMLRLGLTLVVGALAVSEASTKDRELADEWADKLVEAGHSIEGLKKLLAKLDASQESFNGGFLVQLLKRIREHDAPLSAASEWVRARCEAMGTPPDELTRRQHLRQAADQVSVGNAITSMRAIAALDWTRFFELTSSVEEVLQRDPSGAYPCMDQPSRDHCRHAVERLSRRSRYDERRVAEVALSLAENSQGEPNGRLAEAHVGYYLLDAGRRRLEKQIRYRPSIGERLLRPVRSYPTAFYLSSLLILVGLACVGAARLLLPVFDDRWVVLGLLLLFAIPASDVALSLLNALILFILPPRLLPKLDFENGIPDEHRTLVVVPTLLEGGASLCQLLEDLEVRSLANPDKNLYFALVTDFVDAALAETDTDRQLLQEAIDGIEELNRRLMGGKEPRYFLFHRKRLHNPVEDRFMGWERKRGKLEELNRLLRGATDTTFTEVTAAPALLASIRYVITLDTDTELPREVARRLVGAMAHPRNRPVLDPTRHRVISGYGIIQPRVGTLPLSSRRSRFARIFSGPPGVDPYTTAVSDVYQDLFGEGSFVGKGIYDVDAFAAALSTRVPDNRLLSHDLFEGSFARSALATDIEVLDDQPASYEVVASRQHRWLRGDWQLLPWLFPTVPVRGGGRRVNDLRILDLWKLLDNLRRSLLAPALVSLLMLSWFVAPSLAGWALVMIGCVFVGPVLVRQVLALVRASISSKSQFSELGGDLLKNIQQQFLGIMLLFDQALLSLDGIARTLYRLVVSRRRLLEWTTMSQAARRHSKGGARASARFAFSAMAAAVGVAAIVVFAEASIPYSVPLLLTWVAAPSFIGWLGRPESPPGPGERLSEADRRMLRLVARKTWRFFDTFVTGEDNWLPPDNYQEDPRGVVAHRTSPTNIGLYLLSVVAARDFGFITAREVLARLENTLATLSRMERRSGHILNWYDTTTLRPLEPQYVSTVDSGNLAAYLWTLREACADLVKAPLVDRPTCEAASDALRLAASAVHNETSRADNAQGLPAELVELDQQLERAASQPSLGLVEDLNLLQGLHATAEVLGKSAFAASSGAEARFWIEQVAAVLSHALSQARELAPCVEWLLVAPALLHEGPFAQQYAELFLRVREARSPAELSAAAAACLGEVPKLEQALLGHVDIGAEERASTSSFLLELQLRLTRTVSSCRAIEARATKVGEEAVDLADGMDFGFLYDQDRALFAIGYNVSGARLDASHYDLLASEARLASLIAISKGDAPLEHWSMLARPRTVTSAGRALLSWSGSMFEYLMPLLVTGANQDTLLWETCQSAVGRQRAYGAQHGVPWGVSEAAYNVMDLGMTYQYRAFGVPGLGLKSGLGEDLVIAPYATALSAMVRPDHAVENFRALTREGLEGVYGYYESIDYTPGHVPPERRSVIVKAFMAHHQGMTLVALCNVLCDSPMQRRFYADARVKASALLLEERVPQTAAVIPVRSAQVAAPLLGEPELNLTDHVGLAASSVLRVHLLGHGQLSTLVSATGTGVTTWRGLDVTRFREDSALESGGIFVYVRDLTRKRLWSAGQQPTRAVPDYYDASFSIDRAELKRRDGTIETVMEIAVSPEHPVEVRRLTLTNHGDKTCELDVTTYTEAVLAQRGADVAHRAFSSMFVETEVLPERGAILVRRRPRSAHEAETWMVQVLSPDGEGFGAAELDCSRAEFIGRGGSLEKPAAMRYGHTLAGTSGHVLDPGLSLRRRVRLGAGRRARLTLTSALATSREAALELLDLVVAPHSTSRAFELAWADARVELKHLGITAAQSHRFQRLLSCLVFAPPALRDVTETQEPMTRGRQALWSQGISGDLPILLLRIDHPDFGELCRELLLAHEFWRLNGMVCDLVILNEEPVGYLQPLQEAVQDLIRSSPAQGHEDQPGGIFLRRAGQLSEEERLLLFRASRVVLFSSGGSLSHQLRKAAALRPMPEQLLPIRRASPSTFQVTPPVRDQRYFNGLGGFSQDGREYVMNLGPDAKTPAPWCNVMANAAFGSLVSESGSGFTWLGNSQRERLTPWSNDAVCDPSGEVIYLRDQEEGSIWSATPAPASPDAQFVVKHGQGYSVFEHNQGDLEHQLSVFVGVLSPVKFLRLRITNRGARARQLAAYGVVEWVLGASREAARIQVCTHWDAESRTLLANNPFASSPQRQAFLTCTEPVATVTGDREELFGRDGTRSRPAALARKQLSGRTGIGLDPCGALQVLLRLEPGETKELCFVLGMAESRPLARELSQRYSALRDVDAELTKVQSAWDQVLSISAKTPDDAFNLIVNRWLLYQVTSARLWARSGFYQSSGAFGYRDQLQDVLALVHSRPDLTREHLLRAAARQFIEGDVQHWWHPESGEGVRTNCSDDLLWLPYAVAEYVRCTEDHAVLDEPLPFLEERLLVGEEDDLFASPRKSEETATLYEHCVRALTRGATAGPHGLPKMGSGDWNDGMNRVGHKGVGESVWLGWFLARTLQDFAPLATHRKDTERATWCDVESKRLARALEEHAWDGAWYRRAFYDDGSTIGSSENTECRIDAIAQSWSVISGLADSARARQAVRSSETELVVETERMMLLLTPPFADPSRDPGYIRSYPPGIRENGGQYTHGVLWTIHALCQLGEGDRAWKLFSLLNPISHAMEPSDVDRYKVEPYVVAADVYSSPQHRGRGGWTWYTGSASWMYRIAVESILGLRRRGASLCIAPCVPMSWSNFEVSYRYGTSELHLSFDNSAGVATGVRSVELDGHHLPDGLVPLVDDGRRHEVRVVMGEREVGGVVPLRSAEERQRLERARFGAPS